MSTNLDNYIQVTLRDGEVAIERQVFCSLLDLTPIKGYKDYSDALSSGEISLAKLKKLAIRADVPYPLFFAPSSKVAKQVKDLDKNVFDRIPSKREIHLSSRGSVAIEDIKLIVKDLSRKQEFLKNRLITSAPKNSYLGLIAKDAKGGTSVQALAESIRGYLGIDLKELRKKSKGKVLAYLTERAEANNIFVAYSSHHYMPQNLKKTLGMSGLCLKDKFFPIVFINTRDGDADPRILEATGRQTFTLVTMLVCIALNRFFFSNKDRGTQSPTLSDIYAIASEVIIPKKDIENAVVNDLEDLKQLAQMFKVTPSMCLFRLRELRLIGKKLADELKKQLSEEIKKKGGIPRQPLPVNGYLKYNGARFSKEVLAAERRRAISLVELKNVLFRKGKKMDIKLIRDTRMSVGL